jgi:hypothetical protein
MSLSGTYAVFSIRSWGLFGKFRKNFANDPKYGRRSSAFLSGF